VGVGFGVGLGVGFGAAGLVAGFGVAGFTTGLGVVGLGAAGLLPAGLGAAEGAVVGAVDPVATEAGFFVAVAEVAAFVAFFLAAAVEGVVEVAGAAAVTSVAA